MTWQRLEKRYSRLRAIWLKPKELKELDGALGDQARMAVEFLNAIDGMSAAQARQFVEDRVVAAAMPPTPPPEGIP
jgi:hypothetical protein